MNEGHASPAAKRFAVAFSFPGEHRDYVERVAVALLPAFGGGEAAKARIFYDDWHRAIIIGYAANRRLQRVYAEQCDLIVPFYCQEYVNKPWCGVELRAIEALLFDGHYDRVLPFRFDMVEIPGSFKTDIFPVVTDLSPENVAALIVQRYNTLQQTPLRLPASSAPALRREGNLRPVSSVFVGRELEIRRLEGWISSDPGGVVAVIHGTGGIGKSELAVGFADRNSGRFAGGTWILAAESRKAMLPLIGELTIDLGLPPGAGPEETGEQRGRRVLAELRRRARATSTAGALLLLLDNVSEAALLAEPQTSLLRDEAWLRVLATTRLGPDSFGRGGRGGSGSFRWMFFQRTPP